MCDMCDPPDYRYSDIEEAREERTKEIMDYINRRLQETSKDNIGHRAFGLLDVKEYIKTEYGIE